MILNFIDLLLLLAGFTLLVKGADLFTDGASALAKKLKIPTIIIGLTVVAIGTSAPEVSVSLFSAINDSAGIVVGNIIGSNITNALFILGLTALIAPLTFQKNTIKYEIPFVAFITVLLGVFGGYFGQINRLIALIFIILFATFIVYIFKITKKTEENTSEIKTMKGSRIALYIIIGLAALVFGSNLTIESAINIAQTFKVSQRIIGLTIIAFGTSLPELATSCIAAFKGQNDIAVGNIVGSNIFNILFVLGAIGLFRPLHFNNEFIFDCIVALISTLGLLFYASKTKTLTKFQGLSFLLLYVFYLGYLISK